MMIKKQHFYNLWAFVGILMTLVVIMGSLARTNDVPSMNLFLHLDKILHGLSYLALGFWFHQLESKKEVLIFVILICLGIALEILQPIVSNRFFDYWDILANSSGVFVGVLLSKKITLYENLSKLISAS
jgi:VanZ family protein